MPHSGRPGDDADPARFAARLKFELVRESVVALDSAFFTTLDSTLFDNNFTSWTPTFTARSRPKYSPRALPHQHSNRTRAPRTTDCSLSSRAFSSPLIRAMPIPSSSQARGLKKSISMMFLRGRNQDAANPSTTLTTTTSSSTPTTITSFRASDNTEHCNTTNCKDYHCITHRNKMATTIEEQKELELAMREIISSQQKEIARLQGKNKEQEEEMDELRLVGHDQQALLERMTALAAARADENQSLRRDYQRLVDEHRRVVGEILSLPASLAGPSPPPTSPSAPASAPAASTELRARAAEAHQDIRRLAGELDAAAASVDDEKAKVQAIRDEVAAIKAKSAEMAGDNAALERDNEAKRLELAASAAAPARGAAPAAKNKKKKGKKAQK
ncbi:hypothetical protein BJ166DRAFT_503226 [Pestalotiopsis sp. NC0098]|nr:hypothetical protein BJ166DRAFT_503226 [Pestalotiopsis sp. NC0098]